MATTETDWVGKIGGSAYASIAEMVAALECDYDRLEELRDERESLADALEDARQAAHETQRELEDCPHEADEPSESLFTARDASLKAFDDARNALDDWDEANAEELKELEEMAGECKDQDEARERIEEDALSVEVRSDWVTPGEEMTPGEFCILLSTGGPAVRIRGELDGLGQPLRAWLEVQDWFKPWTDYVPADQDTLLTYARCFHFGD